MYIHKIYTVYLHKVQKQAELIYALRPQDSWQPSFCKRCNDWGPGAEGGGATGTLFFRLSC